MDQDDPERRIAELEGRLADGAEQSPRVTRGDAVAMPVSGQPAAPRRFVASAKSNYWASLLMSAVLLGVFAGVPLALYAVFHVATGTTAEWMHYLVVLVLILFAVLMLLSARVRRALSTTGPMVSICPTDNGIEVVRGSDRGEVFPVIGVTLGPWAAGSRVMGTALHLGNGRHRFVLGGQNHQVPLGVQQDAMPVWTVDAWMPAADFDALLTIVYR